MQEIWKDIAGYEGLYQVSNLGNAKSLNYNHTGKPKLLAIKNHHSGYKMVMLCKSGKNTNKTIHVLVANAFIPNPLHKRNVNHIDGDKSNNNVTNLEWVTSSENTRHAMRELNFNPFPNRFDTGVDHHSAKPILQYSKDGTFIKRWNCISDAARALNCNPSLIINNAKKRNKSVYGYIWKYEGE